MIKGIIFDFDGLILDTELPIYEAWQMEYQVHGKNLPLAEYAACVGASFAAFDPVTYLETLTGQTIADRPALMDKIHQRYIDIILTYPPIQGVAETMQQANHLGIQLAVASSSSADWVHGHLQRLNLSQYIAVVCTREDVSVVKPAPDLFLLALQRLGLAPQEAIIFEDSPNGVAAGKAAGIYTIAIPNQLTGYLDLAHADRILPAMNAIPLERLLAETDASVNQGGASL